MGQKYSSIAVSGFNSSPPSDDGSTAASNQVKWSTIKTKLADPLNTFAAAVNSALVTALDQSVRVVTANDSTAATDHDKTIVIGSTVTAAVTVTLADAATMAAGYVVTVQNSSNVACTIGRATASNTINGATSDYTLPAYHSITFVVASPATGYVIKDSNLGRQSNGGASLPAGTAAAPALSAAGDSNTGVFFPAADTVAVTTGGTERVRVDSAGNLGLGVTPSAWGADYKTVSGPVGALAQYQTTSVSLIANAYDSGAGSWKYLNSGLLASFYTQGGGAHTWYTAASGTAGNAITWTTAMVLAATGYLNCPGVYNSAASASNTVNVTNAGDVYRVVSALKYKTDIRDLEPVDINLLRPVRYKSKSTLDDPTQDHLGFIADEVDAAGYKELVNYNDGEVEGLKYERVTVLLVKALQGLRAEFDAYKAAHP